MAQLASTRRAFLTGDALKVRHGFYPPGVSADTIGQCSGCGECAEVCPTKIISMAHGVPILDFQQGECTFCGECSKRCPERVFPPQPATSFSHHAAITDDCLAINYVDCQACRDACPTTAITFRPRIGGPFVPVLNTDPCTGCGACVAVCPSQSITMTQHTMEAMHA